MRRWCLVFFLAIASSTFSQRTSFDSLELALENKESAQSLQLIGKDSDAIPESIGELTNLYSLYIVDCPITTLPQSISKLKNLTELYLVKLPNVVFPDSIGSLRLKALSLQHNNLETVPLFVSKLAAVKDLDLRDNNLSTLPDFVFAIPHLKGLWLQGNNFSEEEKKRIRLALPECWIKFE